MVAARIAAATAFSNSSAVWTGLQSEVGPARAVVLSEIAGGHEPAMGSSFAVGDAELREALLTSIFSPIARDTFAWVHQTFAEFLAAYYLVQHEIPAEHILNFIRSSDDASGHVPPQLREVAAWLASMQPDVFRELLKSEPDILLRSDVASAAPEDREALVRELLKRFDEEQLHDFDRDLLLRYDRLKHPTLAEQLRPYIIGKGKNIVVRRAAISIAQANALTELAPILADVALDISDDVHIRARAVSALARLDAPDQSIRLKSLIERDQEEDVDDELKGGALRALWPDRITVKELLPALTEPKNKNLIGAYWMFLHQFQAPRVTANDANLILEWAKNILRDEDRSRWFNRAIPRFLIAAWSQLNDASVREHFADLFINAVHSGSMLSTDEMKEFSSFYQSGDVQSRHVLVREIIYRTATSGESVAWLMLAQPVALITFADLEWLVRELDLAEAEVLQRAIADLIVSLIFGRNIDEFVFVWELAARHPTLREALARAYSVDLSSALAKWQRDDARRRMRDVKEGEQLFDINENINADLLKIETENSVNWWRLNLIFFAGADGRIDPGKEFEPNLANTEAWKGISPELRDRVIRAAYLYLTQNRVRSSPWLGGNTFHRPAAAGYRAFRLLYSEAPELYREIDKSTWAKWTAAIIGVSFNLDPKEREVRSFIVQRCYEITPIQVCRVINRILAKRPSEFDVADLLNLIEGFFDQQLGQLLWNFAERLEDSDKRVARVFCFLVKMNYQPAVQLTLDSLVRGEPIPGTQVATVETLVSAASALIRSNTQLAWPNFGRIWERNKDLTIRVLEDLAEDWGFREQPFYPRLEEDQLADLFIWSYRHIPPASEERSGKGRFLTAFDHVEQLRNGILQELVARGTLASVAAIKRMADVLPELSWLKWQIVDARRALNAKTWRRLQPSEVIAKIASYRPLLPIRSTKAAMKAIISNSEGPTTSGSLQPFKADFPETVTFPRAPPIEARRWIPRRILAVATEWNSGHGGVSTLNRELCIALAALGHTIVCVVREATEREMAEANAAGVRIVTAPNYPAPEGTDPLLLFNRPLFRGFVPEIIFGHDHITGAAAYHISFAIFDGIPYVHFVHTLPEEIERYKSRTDNSYLRGAKKAEAQLEQCKLAQLVVAIGPRIFRELQTRLAPSSDVKVVQLRPGLNKRLLPHKVDPAKLLAKYCLFMGRFEDADVKGAALACQVIYQLNSSWPGPDRPRLIMRGFDSEDQIRILPGFDNASPYLMPRPYTADPDQIAMDIRSASAIIMPSKREGFGIVGLDGISAGVPILVSSESGLAELLMQEKDISGAIGQTLADSCVADVDGDPVSIASDWTMRLHGIFRDSQAFMRAEQIRVALSPILTWENAAERLSIDIDTILSG